MKLVITIIIAVLLICVCEAVVLCREFDRANKKKRWADEHNKQERPEEL